VRPASRGGRLCVISRCIFSRQASRLRFGGPAEAATPSRLRGQPAMQPLCMSRAESRRPQAQPIAVRPGQPRPRPQVHGAPCRGVAQTALARHAGAFKSRTAAEPQRFHAAEAAASTGSVRYAGVSTVPQAGCRGRLSLVPAGRSQASLRRPRDSRRPPSSFLDAQPGQPSHARSLSRAAGLSSCSR
jgi:hypothetical protein